ncbi:MAG: biotin synthase BioB [Desulfomonilaceae bacterium]
MDKKQMALIELLEEVEDRIIQGGAIERSEAESLKNLEYGSIMKLTAAADRIRINFLGNRFDSCSLVNAKSGLCSEDCAFCAQSSKHGRSSEVYGLKSTDEILAAAKNAKAFGAGRFCTVTSGGALSEEDFERLTDTLRILKTEVDIALDASLGFLNETRASKLFSTGVSRYNHNLESSREFYPSICSTHSYEARVETVKLVKSKGASACCGGIIGLGETSSQRLDLAFTLADLGVDCVPINILNPRPGTRLENAQPPEPLEIIKTVAMFRLILPRSTIKIAGGRERNLGDFQAMALRSGANGMIIGGYLTTGGRSVEADLEMVRQAGFEIGSYC